MVKITNGQFAILATVPVVTIVLVWTMAIFQKHRKKWTVFDVPVVALLFACTLRNLTVLTFVIMTLIPPLFDHRITVICTTLIWLFNALHTFQMSLLTTMAIGYCCYRRRYLVLIEDLHKSHVIYHIACLLVLSSCIGVAGILGYHHRTQTFCPIMPFDLDEQFYIFVMVLNGLLATILMTTFLVGTTTMGDTIISAPRRDDDCMECTNSTDTVSSINSRKPCITPTEEPHTTNRLNLNKGLKTTQPVLLICFLIYHLPIIVLSAYPNLVLPYWTVEEVVLCLGITQDLLIPVGLCLLDPRFSGWVGAIYRCRRDKIQSQLNSTTTKNNSTQLIMMNTKQGATRFPITNGSLYTSIDGRLPIIHNYRRSRRFKQNNNSNIDGQYQEPFCFNCLVAESAVPSYSNLVHQMNPKIVNDHTKFWLKNQEISSTNVPTIIATNQLNQDNNKYHPNRPDDDDDYYQDEDFSITTEANGDFDYFNISTNNISTSKQTRVKSDEYLSSSSDHLRQYCQQQYFYGGGSRQNCSTENLYLSNNSTKSNTRQELCKLSQEKHRFIHSVPDLKVFLSEYI